MQNLKFKISKILQAIMRPRVNYQPLIEVRVFKSAILNNLENFKNNYPKFKFAPVLKSNAYGHGLKEVAEVLDDQGCPFFVVDSFFEALVLRREGIKTPVLVLGYATMEQINKSNLKDVSFTVIDLGQLQNIAVCLKRPTLFHLKIDTGMHRQGILPADLAEAIKIINTNKNIIIEGGCSHLADADGETNDFTNQQILKWNKVAGQLKKEFPNIKYHHLSNTAGASFAEKIDANVSRLGIGLYGFGSGVSSRPNASESRDPDWIPDTPRMHSGFRNDTQDNRDEIIRLKPALEMVSLITSIKTIPAGEKVGYNITYTASRETRVATVPVGYNEGLDRRLSNRGWVKIKNTFCPIVGRISMNMCSVDVTEVDGVKLEDEVIVISADKTDKNSVENIAKTCGMIHYEVLVRIPQNLRRKII